MELVHVKEANYRRSLQAASVLIILVMLWLIGGQRWPPSLTPGAAFVAAYGSIREVDAITNSIGMRLRRIPAGEFEMGSRISESGRLRNEGPTRKVRILRPFLLSERETTIGDFRRFVAETGYVTEAERDAKGGFGIDFRSGAVVQDRTSTWRNPGFPEFQQTDQHPVILVSWNDANAFCDWLSKREDTVYRLPTEAEWEFACRAGTQSRFWTGQDEETLNGAANIADASLVNRHDWTPEDAGFDDGFPYTAPVASFEANPLGLHDMHGNAWEWCSDWYMEHSYLDNEIINPKGPAVGTFRVIRGGGWLNGPSRNRSAQRPYFQPTFRFCLLSGFRVLREID